MADDDGGRPGVQHCEPGPSLVKLGLWHYGFATMGAVPWHIELAFLHALFADLLRESGGENTCRKGNEAYADQAYNRTDDLPEGGRWDDVAVSDGCEGDDGPPHAGGNASKWVVRARLIYDGAILLDDLHRDVLDEVDRGGGKNQKNYEDEHRHRELFFLSIQDGGHGLDGVRVPTHLEDPEQAHQADSADKSEV